jgi:cobalt-zinc-cadmium efflux system membrane fusion protein
VVLENPKNELRPGLFVTVHVALEELTAAVVVPRSAVQILDEEEIVFVQKGDGFAAVPVSLGRGDSEVVEIRSGLKAGQRYVSRGAFELKAKIATSGMDAHAGHGH